MSSHYLSVKIYHIPLYKNAILHIIRRGSTEFKKYPTYKNSTIIKANGCLQYMEEETQ